MKVGVYNVPWKLRGWRVASGGVSIDIKDT